MLKIIIFNFEFKPNVAIYRNHYEKMTQIRQLKKTSKSTTKMLGFQIRKEISIPKILYKQQPQQMSQVIGKLNRKFEVTAQVELYNYEEHHVFTWFMANFPINPHEFYNKQKITNLFDRTKQYSEALLTKLFIHLRKCSIFSNSLFCWSVILHSLWLIIISLSYLILLMAPKNTMSMKNRDFSIE